MFERSPIARFLTMPDQHTDAEAKLKKLGDRLRQGFAKQHPVSEKNLETVRGAIRDQYEQEQAVKREAKPAPDASKERDRKSPEPGQDR
jgi:hypothetical protein